MLGVIVQSRITLKSYKMRTAKLIVTFNFVTNDCATALYPYTVICFSERQGSSGRRLKLENNWPNVLFSENMS